MEKVSLILPTVGLILLAATHIYVRDGVISQYSLNPKADRQRFVYNHLLPCAIGFFGGYLLLIAAAILAILSLIANVPN